jgi:hypothetical protein
MDRQNFALIPGFSRRFGLPGMGQYVNLARLFDESSASFQAGRSRAHGGIGTGFRPHDQAQLLDIAA